MSRYKFHSSHKTQSAHEQLAAAPFLPFLQAMDLLMIQSDELYRTLRHRVDPADMAEEKTELREMKHAASQAKMKYLQEMKELQERLAQRWIQSGDPQLAKIGACLLIGNYQRLAR